MEKVMVAMSGGVDSSVAALLLKEQGYDVVGITMQIWPQPEDNSKACCSLEAVNDARRVAYCLDIPHYVMNLRDVFKAEVIDYFCREYVAGKTPNPCIACNRHIKFAMLLNKALALQFQYIATGHYARIVWDKPAQNYLLLTGVDARKDQSYALYNLTQAQLAHTLFPLGSYTKKEVRGLARKAGLPVSEKKESQEICFVPDKNYAGFIEKHYHIDPPKGWIKNDQGEKLLPHQGIHHFTIGQRKHLGLALGHPVYVNRIDAQDGSVWVSEEKKLFNDRLIAEDVNFISGETFNSSSRVSAKIRYKGALAEASAVNLGGNKVEVRFDKPQRAITPGQAVVFYKGEQVLGGGTIAAPAGERLI